MDEATRRALRMLPALGELLRVPAARALQKRYGAGMVKLALRAVIDEARRRRRDGREACTDAAALLDLAARQLRRRLDPAARRVINATGILLHTGLGRAPLCDEALAAMRAAGRYTVLQTSLETGKRNLREEAVEQMLRALTGCEAATVVNNNAAATMLILNALAEGKGVIISRGQLIEIGGAFRMPDVMDRSGAVMREVGTTNRTHLRDYEAAIDETVGALIHVHTSNYRVRGFSGTPSIRELALLAKRYGLPMIDDLGSGALAPLSEWGLPDEPLVGDSLAAGADVVCFSGDKLIGGPQSGIVCGNVETIARIRKNPFARMFRVDKLTLAGLEATLPHFVNDTFREAIPFYRMLSRSREDLRAEAEAVADALRGLEGIDVAVEDDLSYIGSGSLPDEGVPTSAVTLNPREGRTLEGLARKLRLQVPSVFGRLRDEALCCDMRTLLEGDREALVDAIRRAAGSGA